MRLRTFSLPHGVTMDQNGHRDGVYGQSNTAVHHSSMEVIQNSELLFHHYECGCKEKGIPILVFGVT